VGRGSSPSTRTFAPKIDMVARLAGGVYLPAHHVGHCARHGFMNVQFIFSPAIT
jgi:hypothetical protein